jgi:hypothetical protein
MTSLGRSVRLLRAIAVAPIVIALALGAETVRAALWLDFDPTSGPPGSTIAVRTHGHGAFGASPVGDAFPLYLVVDDSTDQLLRIGAVTVDIHHDGIGSFVVPEVAPGEYGSMIRCEPCAEHSAGRTLLPMGPFTVLSEAPNTATANVDRPRPSSNWLVGLTGLLAGLSTLLLFQLRLGRRHR